MPVATRLTRLYQSTKVLKYCTKVSVLCMENNVFAVDWISRCLGWRQCGFPATIFGAEEQEEHGRG